MHTLTVLTMKQFAEACGLPYQQVARLVRRGEITPANTLTNGSYLFTQEQVEEFIEARAQDHLDAYKELLARKDSMAALTLNGSQNAAR